MDLDPLVLIFSVHQVRLSADLANCAIHALCAERHHYQ